MKILYQLVHYQVGHCSILTVIGLVVRLYSVCALLLHVKTIADYC
jgi:hypothetical protein